MISEYSDKPTNFPAYAKGALPKQLYLVKHKYYSPGHLSLYL